MKCLLATAAVISLSLTACETMNQPVTRGNFDPLQAPGTNQASVEVTSTTFTAGRFVRAIMDNTAFFKARPKADADADKLLPRGTSMKVISSSDSYVKVELDSGEVGWVPSVMLEDPSAAAPSADSFSATNPGEIQVYPPVGGYGSALPPVNPAELPPEGAIPTVIDPDAPATPAPVPPATVPRDHFSAPGTTPPDGEKKIGSIGIPFPHTKVRIIDPATAADCATDVVGEEMWTRKPLPAASVPMLQVSTPLAIEQPLTAGLMDQFVPALMGRVSVSETP